MVASSAELNEFAPPNENAPARLRSKMTSALDADRVKPVVAMTMSLEDNTTWEMAGALDRDVGRGGNVSVPVPPPVYAVGDRERLLAPGCEQSAEMPMFVTARQVAGEATSR